MTERTKPRRKRKKSLWIALVLLPALAGAGFAWSLRPSGDPTANFRTVAVIRGDVENAVTAVGVLHPSRYVEVGAQVSGQLKTLHAEVGDLVRQGDLLAVIDPRVYLARVEEAQATLANLRAQLKIEQAQLTLCAGQSARHQELLRQDALAASEAEISEAALATAKAQIEAIEARIAQAEAAHSTARVNLGYTRIAAPMGGTVVSIAALEGQTLNANQQTPVLLRIADLDLMTVWTQVSEADVLRLQPGQEVYFTVLGEPGRRWQGKLRQVLPTPELVNGVVFYNALFDVPNPGHELRVQMTAQVFFVLERAEQVLMVPATALGGGQGQKQGAAQGGGDRKVQVLRPDGTVEARRVEVGVRTALNAEIVSGLGEGETVVVGAAATARGEKKNGLGGGKGKL